MTFSLPRRAGAAFGLLVLSACGVSSTSEEELDGDAIVSLSDDEVNRQEIGNCWSFATTSWLESLHYSATGQRVDLSESYLTYWMLFERLTAPRVYPSLSEVPAGSNWGSITSVLQKVGVVPKAAFLPADLSNAQSQSVAYAYVNKWLRKGGMKKAPSDMGARRVVLRRMLDQAFGLSPEVVADMDLQFGDVAMNSFASDESSQVLSKHILSPREFLVSVPDESRKKTVSLPLSSTIGAAADIFEEIEFPSSGGALEQREFFRRVQKTLHAGSPLYLSWYADPEAESAAGVFRQSQVPFRGSVEGVGWHASLIVDYEATVASGKTYKAGEPVTDPAALSALLEDNTRVDFLRIKNSWGPRKMASNTPKGFNDIYLDYFVGPNPICAGLQPEQAAIHCPRGPYIKSVVALKEPVVSPPL